AALLERLQSTRAAELSARTDLLSAISKVLPRDPTQDFQHLDSRYPIVLFPVRIETRFDRASLTLLIRIYPDEILADSHEPELSMDEQTAGTKYWQDSAWMGEP